MKFAKIELAALFALIICVFMSTYNLDKECDGIRNGILRLHVIAASDSGTDQEIKLQLRDRLLLKGNEIFKSSKTKKEAEKKIREGIPLLEKEAAAFLKEKGYNSSITVSLTKSYFPTRKYEGFTLPAGNYDALKVVIGEGKGKNWWCIMFPALCIPAAKDTGYDLDAILTDKEKAIITEEKYEVRLWLVEKWQELNNFLIYNN